jgi:basic amino acid/polyamine antiporter, APA family
MSDSNQLTQYARRLGVFDAAMVTVGGIIGAGIFLSPAIVAQRVHTADLVLTVWVLGGIIAVAGALTFAELGGRRPQAGGGYVYLREAFGPLPAFLYGWTFLVIINTGGMAAVAVTFAQYTVALTGAAPAASRPIAVASILCLTAVNCFGIRAGATTQNVFTVLKLVALAAVVAAGVDIAVAHGLAGFAAASPSPAATATGGDLVRVIGVALIPVLFTYGGWAHANNVAGEMKDPVRTLPRAMGLGIAIVVAVYVAANVAYVVALGPAGLAVSTAPASDTMRRAVGPIGGTIIGLGIAASSFGFVNLTILSAPRILQTMAVDGLFFSRAATLHPRYRTPTVALLAQAVWAVALTCSGTYSQLLDYTVFGDWIFFGLIAATIFYYRKRDTPDTVPYFRAPGYPVVPAAFILTAAYVVGSSVRSTPRNAVLGFCLIALGVPMYALWRMTSRPRSPQAVERGA